jgi:DNA modification methylase
MAKKSEPTELFAPAQPDLYEKSYEEQLASRRVEPVECLGETFPSDDARREHYLGLLAEKLKDPEFRKQPGFPIGEDEDILRLSDPPYYTACPNPFLAKFVEFNGNSYRPEEHYSREPFASDVKQGKGGSIYKAHTYHTKVPHEAIASYILHYTNPGDVVLDAFAGSGMTGVACSFCGDPSDNFLEVIKKEGRSFSLGNRHAVLTDLSPFASFLSHNISAPIEKLEFLGLAENIISASQKELPKDIYGKPEVSYVVWSQVLQCPECSHEIKFAEQAFLKGEAISSKFSCPSCGAKISKSSCNQQTETWFDPLLQRPVTQKKYAPILVSDKGSNSRRKPNENDLETIRVSNNLNPDTAPVVPMMFNDQDWGDMFRAGYHSGISNVHHFWTRRNLLVISKMWEAASVAKAPNLARFLITSFLAKTGSKMHNIGIKAGKVNLAGQIFNTLQIPSVFAERNIFDLARGKAADLAKVYEIKRSRDDVIVSTGSSSSIKLPENTIDYVFVDPPFGGNIMYSEMSFLYEAWLGVFTNNIEEAIISKKQEKDIVQYRKEMVSCFKEIFRVLKPERWITVAFHNSQNEVWIALQETLQRSGFVIGDVSILDKGQGTYKQMTTAGSVEKDLAISAYKPGKEISESPTLSDGKEEDVWEFTAYHLRHLPVEPNYHEGKIDKIAERMDYILFDRLIAYFVYNEINIPISASAFYSGLSMRYAERDGMYFLPEQVIEYDKVRQRAGSVRQLELMPIDETSTIQWLRQELSSRPRTYAALQPVFMKISVGWAKNEKPIELSMVLDANFLRYDGDGEVPNQVHAYLSSNFKDMRNKDKSDPELRRKGKDRWYVPDPNKLQDLEAKREKQLLKEFDEYLASKEKRIKQPRHEVIRAGFKRAWGNRDFESIKAISGKIPEAVIQGDQQLLMWYDMAMTRLGDDNGF